MLDNQLQKNIVVVEDFETSVGLSLNGHNPTPTEYIEMDNLQAALNLKSALINPHNNAEIDIEKVGKGLSDEKIGSFTLEDEHGFREVEIWSMGDDGLVLNAIGDDGEKAMKISKRMKQVLEEAPETLKRQTALKMQELGLITITDSWVLRSGNPGRIKGDGRPGQVVSYFKINPDAKGRAW